MKKKILSLAAILILITGSAFALTYTNLYGDIDGFGIDFPVDGSFSSSYINLSKNDTADVDTITDEWLVGDKIWSHTYDISNIDNVVGISLEIVTIGQGWHGISNLYFNNQYVGELTDGDNSEDRLFTNWSRLDTYDLSAFAYSTDGINSIRIDTFGDQNDDQWALDYSKITLNTVPVPAAIWLLGSGILSLAVIRKKNQS